MSRKHSIAIKCMALFLATSTALTPALGAAAGIPRIGAPPAGVPRAAAAQSSGIPRALSNLVPPVAGTLPVRLKGGVLSNAELDYSKQNELTVNQNADKAVIDWESFDIASGSTVYFSQNKDWSALNRIWNADPTRIFGALKADGKIYLINRNGILFGRDARVNVGSITASSLHITKENFEHSLLKFSNQQGKIADEDGNWTDPDQDMQPYTPGAVVNEGEITAAKLGAVFLIGSQVENRGRIDAPVGQVGLVAGSEVAGEEVAVAPDEVADDEAPGDEAPGDEVPGDEVAPEELNEVELAPDKSAKRRYLVQVTANPGIAVNREEGTITSEAGVVGMYGRDVEQDGIITAVTTLQKNGVIELLATDSIRLGAGSRTESPISDSTDTAHESFEFKGGDIQLKGLIPVLDTVPDGNRAPVKRIELAGEITAPSGKVVLEASDRVYLENGSRIDVSGATVEKPAEANLVEFTYTSDNLKDEFQQKGGFLQGETVKVDAHQGAAIGDISGYLTSREKSAREQAVKGGEITLTAGSGEVIVREDAELDFAGGKTDYAAGSYATTFLMSQGKAYDIATAPRELAYDGVTEKVSFHAAHSEGADAGTLTVVGRAAVLDGAMDGSVSPGVFQTLADEKVNGTGTYSTRGRKAPLPGTLIMGVPPSTDKVPQGVDLVLGDTVVKARVNPLSADFGPESALASRYEGYGDGTTFLSAERINASGIGTLSINTNTSFLTEADAMIKLQPGGDFSAAARHIEHGGAIIASGGKVSLTTYDNITSYEILQDADGRNSPNPRFVELPDEGISLLSGSLIDAAGEFADNGPAVDRKIQGIEAKRTGGGSISIMDNTAKGHGVNLAAGALLDVSGGFVIDGKGKVSGGDAGSIAVQGSVVLLDGEVYGFSLVGKEGGSISIHAGEVVVAADAAAVDNEDGTKTVIDDDRFAGGGFSSIELKAEHDLTVERGVRLAPSRMKMISSRGGVTLGEVSGDLIGPPKKAGDGKVRGINLVAGENLERNDKLARPGVADARLVVAEDAEISVIPGWDIRLSGPEIDLAGTLDAPAGKITLKAINGIDIRKTSRLLARGYNRLDLKPVARNVPLGYTVLNGGTISVESLSLNMAQGALFDVSGSAPVTSYGKTARGAVVSRTVAGAPGEVRLTYTGNVQPEGLLAADFRAGGAMPGLQGGTFSLISTSIENGLSLDGGDLARLAEAGFDSLAFTSNFSLNFQGDVNLAAGRKIVLDAPRIISAEDSDVSLKAPWLVLRNSYLPGTADEGTADEGTADEGAARASLSLDGDWLDVEGAVILSGFATVNADIARDIRLFDRDYIPIGKIATEWHGSLTAPGDLTLKADRIYPGMNSSLLNLDSNDPEFTTWRMAPSDFLVKAGGDITILPSDERSNTLIPSAGGSLKLEAGGNILHKGTLAAPNGTITLEAGKNNVEVDENNVEGDEINGRVYLADGSVTTVKGDGAVPFGEVNELFWEVVDKKETVDQQSNEILTGQITAEPEKGVTITGNEVIVRDGALIDASGGGELYGYLFQKGLEGSHDPLKKSGRYVILPDNSVQMPGDRVYLEGSDLLAAGYYTILPEQYAFISGAVIITDTGKAMFPGDSKKSSEGYSIVAGSMARDSTDLGSSRVTGFEMRRAEDVLREGNFTVASLETGNAGSVTLKGDSTVLETGVAAQPLAGYGRGRLELGANNVHVQEAQVTLPAGFNFAEALPDDLRGQLFVTADSISNSGFSSVTLSAEGGDLTETNTLTVENGSRIEGGSITLKAEDSVMLGEDVTLIAWKEAGDGVVTIAATGADGDIAIGAGSEVRGEGGVTIDTVTLDLQETDEKKQAVINARGGTLTLASKVVQFTEGDAIPEEKGFHITDKIWNLLGAADADAWNAPAEIVIKGRQEVAFRGNRNLDVTGDLVIDAPRITASGAEGSEAAIVVSADNLTLRNSGGKSTVNTLDDTGAITMKASTITVDGARYDSETKGVTGGDVRFDGVATLALESAGDLTFRGKGSLATDADLTLSAGRVTTTYQRDEKTPYTPADFRVAAVGAVTVVGSGGTAGTTVTPGGSLEIEGRNIEIKGTGVIDTRAGQMKLTATGSADGEGVWVRDGAKLIAGGTDDAAGGSITLKADSGAVGIDAGALVDVSAGAQGDAGSVIILAENGDVKLAGTVTGAARDGGRGGSLIVDAARVGSETDETGLAGDFTAVVDTATAGGFTETVDARIRTGDVTIAEGKILLARNVRVAADSGNLTVEGTVDASHLSGGGRVELYAGKDLTIADGGEVKAAGTGTGASGGEVILGSAARSATEIKQGAVPGTVTVADGGSIDVSGSGGEGGTVLLRAQYRLDSDDAGKSDVNIDIAGSIKGAREIVAAGVAVKEYTVDKVVSTTAETDTWKEEADIVMTNAAAITSRLTGAMDEDAKAAFHYRPDLEVRSTGKLTMNTDLDLSTWRFDGEPGYLTLRAEKDLVIDKKIVDHPTDNPEQYLRGSTALPSWGIRLAAGADVTGANPLAVKRSAVSGDLKLSKDTSLVYTESGALEFASGRDTIVAKALKSGPNYMTNSNLRYNLATFKGNIRGEAGRDLNIAGGAAIQSGVGDISIRTWGNLVNNGAIRTTGEDQRPVGASGKPHYWSFAGGGDIALTVGKAVEGTLSATKAWDNTYLNPDAATKGILPRIWAADYTGTATQTEGIATMGGGSVTVTAGGGFTGQAGTFGKGDLTITSGKDLTGRFLVKEGAGRLTAMGNFGTPPANAADLENDPPKTVLELFDGRFEVRSQGDVELGTVVNPTLYKAGIGKWNLSYGENAAVSLASRTGNISFYGTGAYTNFNKSDAKLDNILPATVEMDAAGDIRLYSNIYMAPARNGNLVLKAGGDIDGSPLDEHGGMKASIFMSDLDPGDIYGQSLYFTDKLSMLTTSVNHATVPVHQDDPQPVEITSGGDIRNLGLLLPKKAVVTAGRDISNIYFEGQNLEDSDVTLFSAGRDILLQSKRSVNGGDVKTGTGFVLSGPGAFIVRADRNIDLGTTSGIQADGNAKNSALPDEGASIIVAAGINPDAALDDQSAFYTMLKYTSQLALTANDGRERVLEEAREALVGEAGARYYELLAQWKEMSTGEIVAGAREKVIAPFMGALDNYTAAFDFAARLAKATKEERAGVIAEAAKALVDPYAGAEGTIDGDRRYAGERFVELLSGLKDGDDAAQLATNAVRELYLGSKHPDGGSVNMTSSEISTSAGSDVSILASRDLNAGKTVKKAKTAENTGIYTAAGGGINILTIGDVNVNESRVMTFRGGDILLWSDREDINAGRGSRTTVSTSPPKTVPIKDEEGTIIGYKTVFTPPQLGSGVRAVTYDPDGVQGPDEAPEPGYVYPIAPEGIVDAGEAGVAGGRIFVLATSVLNAQNFSAGAGGMVGVPTSSGSLSIGSVAGSGSVTDSSKMMEQASSVGAGKDNGSGGAAEEENRFATSWLDVKVIGFDTENQEEEKEKE